MSESMLVRLINFFLQKYLDCDPEVARRLHGLEGSNLVFRLKDLDREFLVIPRQAGIDVTEYRGGESDGMATWVETDMQALARAVLCKACESMLEDGTLHVVRGDPGPARQLAAVLDAVEMDWEELASAYLGDLPAHQIGSWLRKTRQYRRRSLENFMSDVSEFLQEESRILPARAEMERYLEDTEELDASIAGLEDRIRRLTEAD